MRALSSLGKEPESYGSLLTAIVLARLPHEIKKNLAREHTNSEWTIEIQNFKGTTGF